MNRKICLCLALSTLLVLALALLLRSPAFALLGDVDLNNLINQADLSAIAQRLGASQSSPNYNRLFDLSLDDKINVVDLAIAGRSVGSPRSFHFLRQISNQYYADLQDACLDGFGRLNVAWFSKAVYSYLYFSRLDRFGNTLIDDVQLDLTDYIHSVAIACDNDGNAHIFWIRDGKLYQARFDRWGFPVIPPQVVYNEVVSSTPDSLGAAADQHNNTYVFFRRYPSNLPTLLQIQPRGELAQVAVGLRSGASNTSSRYHQLVVDPQENLHLLWYEGEGRERLYYARYANQAAVSINERLVGYTNYDGSWNMAQKPDLKVDSGGNAYILWHEHNTPKLRLEKIAPNGDTLLDDFELFSQWQSNGYTPPSEIAFDQAGQLHLLTLTGWGRSVSHSAYGTFSPQGAPLLPLRWIFYGTPMYEPRLLVDSQQDVHITFRNTSSKGYPPCEDDALCYLSTAFNPESSDLNRSDLGIDAAHLSYEPLISRWGGTLTITTTVYNEGWTGSPAGSLWIALETADGQKLKETSLAINPLAPHNTQTLAKIQLALPATPPPGLEEMEYLRLHLKVDPQNAIPETSEENNDLAVPILVQKLPTRTGLFLIVEDETYTARGGVSERLNVGSASIQGGSYSRENIPVTEDITVLSRDIPVTNDLVNYTVNWQAPGYAVPAPVILGVRRNSSDPYRIDYTPGNTAVLKTNRWGSLSGNISSGGSPLTGATVRLVGEGLSIETTTGADGNFSPAAKPELAKLIPGQYQIRVSKAGYARLIETLTIQPLTAYTFNRSMSTTEQAYLHGNVINTYGNAVSGATVNACGAETQTDAQGVFDLTVNASCTTLQITRNGYAPLNESLSLTAGLETLLNDLEMTFDPPVTLFSKEDRVASRVIDQSSGDLLPEAPEDASWVEKQIFDKFKDKFWPEYRVYIAYGAYAYNAAAAYSGTSTEHYLQFIQVYFEPQTFEVHALLASVNFNGAPIPIPIVSTSGIRSAMLVIEARLVNVKSGEVLKTVAAPLEGGASEWISDSALLTYDFGGQAISDWENTEVWLFYKVGKMEDGQFTSPPQLYLHDRQIMKFNLSSGEIRIDYGLGEFPLP